MKSSISSRDFGQAPGLAAHHGVDDGDVPAIPDKTSDQIGADEPAATRHHHPSAHQCTSLLLPTAKYELPSSDVGK